jgi:hypothetical protein
MLNTGMIRCFNTAREKLSALSCWVAVRAEALRTLGIALLEIKQLFGLKAKQL